MREKNLCNKIYDKEESDFKSYNSLGSMNVRSKSGKYCIYTKVFIYFIQLLSNFYKVQ